MNVDHNLEDLRSNDAELWRDDMLGEQLTSYAVKITSIIISEQH